ncbi:MAG TPA: AgmX/PglI C-terminal domain-containing protein [Polyangiaceae bacterium]|nr:AgmX/PglI C-terminal domain-containing protein [Polyangiaceae bacterium]
MRIVSLTAISPLLVPLSVLIACGGGAANSEAASPAQPAEQSPAAAEPSSAAGAQKTDPSESVSGSSTSATDDSKAATAPAAENDDAPVEETRTMAVIQDVFKTNRPKVRACFDETLKKHPGLKGNLTISFVINPKGTVKEVTINTARSDLNVAELNACVIDTVLKISFPPSSRGFESQGNYPFNFNP